MNIEKKDANWKCVILNKIKLKRDSNKKIIAIECMRDIASEAKKYKRTDGWEDIKYDDSHKKERHMAKMIASLFYYYGLNNSDCGRFFELRKERNTSAHEAYLTSYDFADLKAFFDDIITKIIKKESTYKI